MAESPDTTEDLNPAHPHVRPAARPRACRLGRAELGAYNYTANRVIFATLQNFCETALVQN